MDTDKRAEIFSRAVFVSYIVVQIKEFQIIQILDSGSRSGYGWDREGRKSPVLEA